MVLSATATGSAFTQHRELFWNGVTPLLSLSHGLYDKAGTLTATGDRIVGLGFVAQAERLVGGRRVTGAWMLLGFPFR